MKVPHGRHMTMNIEFLSRIETEMIRLHTRFFSPISLEYLIDSTQEIKKWPENGNNDSSQQPYVNLLENWEASNRWILWLIKIFYLYYWQTGAFDYFLYAW